MVTAKSKDQRLDMRLTSEHKELLEEAAALAGLSATAFATEAILARAHEVISRSHQTELSVRDFEALCKMLDQPRKPNAALKRAAKRFKAARG